MSVCMLLITVCRESIKASQNSNLTHLGEGSLVKKKEIKLNPLNSTAAQNALLRTQPRHYRTMQSLTSVLIKPGTHIY